MNRLTKRLTLALALLAPACGGSDSDAASTGGFDAHPKAQAIVESYADNVVVGSYELLAQRLKALETAAKELQANTTQDNLTATRGAWVAAREPWEQSEAFLFGPVDSFGFDPALDSWPVNRTDLDAVLASSDALTPDYIANLDPTLRGFHTAEYLIFGEGGDLKASDLDARETEYLVAVTGNMAKVGADLAASWTQGSDGTPYVEVFKTAGTNSVYPSRQSAAEEIVRGMIGIADEVANGKIADPYEQKDPNLVESQFSYNSLLDFQDNVRSMQNAYTGDNPEAQKQGAGLDEFIAALDPALDQRVKLELEASIQALAAIPGNFSKAVTDPAAADEIEAAQATLRTLKTTLEQDVLPKVLD